MSLPQFILKEYPQFKNIKPKSLNKKIFDHLRVFTNNIPILTTSLIINVNETTPINEEYPFEINEIIKVLNKLENLDDDLLNDFIEYKNVKILFLIIYKTLFIKHNTLEKQKNYFKKDKIEYIQKLLKKIDISNIYEELVDKIFNFLEPQTYSHYEKLRSFSEQTYQKKEKEIRTAIYNYLHENGIDLFIKARLKSIYSIHRKIEKKNILYSQVLDIIGLRIIVPKVKDCYQTLELLIQKWPVLNSKIKDYIAIPKDNDYKSLHITIIYQDIPVEIQIRTQEMHMHAEYGLSSHFEYKKSLANKKLLTSSMPSNNKDNSILNKEGYRFLFHHSPIGQIILDKNCCIIDINQVMINMLDSDFDSLIGYNIMTNKILNQNGFSTKLLDALNDNKIQGEIPYETRYGRNIILKYNIIPITGSNKEIIGLQTVAEDITNFAKNQQELIESKKKYKLLVETQTDLILKSDKDGKFLFTSPSYCDLFNTEENKLIGQTMFSIVHEDDKNIVIENLKKIHYPPYSSYFEVRCLTKFGWRWIAWASKAVQKNSDINFIISVGRDITGRKKLEIEKTKAKEALEKQHKILQNIIDTIPHSIYWKDENSVYLGCNKHFALESGLSSPQDIIGKTDNDFSWKNRAPIYQNFDQHVITNNASIINLEQESIKKDGTKKEVLTSKAPLLNSQKKPIGVIGVDTDVTKLKNVQKQLNYKTEFQKLITHISTEFINIDPYKIESEIQKALQEIANFSNVDSSYIYLYDEKNTKLIKSHEWSNNEVITTIKTLQEFKKKNLPWLMSKIDNSEIIHIPSVENLPDFAKKEKELFLNQAIKSLIMVPLTDQGKVLGFIGFDSLKDSKKWNEDTITLLKIVAKIFINALVKKNTINKLSESKFKYHKLYSSINEGVGLFNLIYNKNNEAIDYKFLDINPALEKIIGHKKTDIINKKASEIFIEKPLPLLNEFIKISKEKKPLNIETYFEPINKHLKVSIFTPTQQTIATVFSDVTPKRQAEKKVVELYRHLGIINRRVAILLNINKRKNNNKQEQLQDFVLESAIKLSQANFSLLYKFNEESNELNLLNYKKIKSKDIKQIENITPQEFPWIRPIINNQIRSQHIFTDETPFKSKLILALPLIDKEKLLGALLLGFDKDEPISTQELEFFDIFAIETALSIKKTFTPTGSMA